MLNFMYKCKYCGKEYEKATQVAGHTGRCKNNPNRIKNIEKTNKYLQNANKQRLENIKANPKYQKKEYTFKCKKCGKIYTLILNENQYNNGKYSKYCSKSCANSHINENNEGVTKNLKIFKKCNICGKDTLVSAQLSNNKVKCDTCKQNQYNILPTESYKICNICNKHYKYILGINTKKFCCKECQMEYHENKLKYLSIETRNTFSETARKNIAKMENIRRSKNEIYFCELCEKYFKNVEHNLPLFNGWDADIIIHDIKYAIMWNGKWHYEEMNFKGSHQSLAQIQNRDKIKEKEILNYGYKLYIIKDMGGYNKKFVEKEFNNFIIFLHNNNIMKME